jgi:IS1 family transposase
MNRLPLDRQEAVIRCLVEGNSIRATVRITGVAKNTITNLLRDVGAACLDHHDAFVRGVSAREIEADEIWSFCGSKEKNTSDDARARGNGDVWTWTGMDRTSKLMIAYQVGKRDADTAKEFVDDLASRLAHRVQLSTDGLKLYIRPVADAFGGEVDYGQIVKLYGPSFDGASHQRRYSQAACIGYEKKVIEGEPKEYRICTSHMERSNLTMRMSMRRFTRLTNAFSKKLENHVYAIALHFAFYNFCRPHMTLTARADGVPTTPGMRSGLTDRIWTIYDLLALKSSN